MIVMSDEQRLKKYFINYQCLSGTTAHTLKYEITISINKPVKPLNYLGD